MDPLVLTFDIGTQSIRALLVDKKGDTVLCHQLRYERIKLPSNVPGRAEQEPDFYYDRLCEAGLALRRMADRNPGKRFFERIKAVTITCIRDTVMILDKDCKPLRNIILWLDERRTDGEVNPVWWQKVLFASVGMTETVRMLYKDAFVNWIRENEPELWERNVQVRAASIIYELQAHWSAQRRSR